MSFRTLGSAPGSSFVPRVLVVGDDLLTESLTSALEAHGLVTAHVVPRNPDLEEAIGWHPYVGLLDVEPLGPVAGSALIGRLRAADIVVGVISGGPDHHGLETWLDAGASAVIDKSAQFVELFGMVNRLLGRASVEPLVTTSPTLRCGTWNRRDEARRAPFAILTEREQEVLAELMDGHCAEEIANAAFVSISTVRSQIKSVLQKLGVNSQLAAVALARQAGWSLDRKLGKLDRRSRAS